MAKKLFPDHELYLLENWADAAELEASMDSVREKYEEILKNVLRSVRAKHKELDCQGIHLGYPADYTLNIGVGKKSWPSLPKWPSGFWLSDLWLENLTSEDENHPSANVYIQPEKFRLNLDEAVNSVLGAARRILPKDQAEGIEVASKKAYGYVSWPLPEPRRELLDLLRNDGEKVFADRLVEHFEVLTQFTPVMDTIFEGGRRDRK